MAYGVATGVLKAAKYFLKGVQAVIKVSSSKYCNIQLLYSKLNVLSESGLLTMKVLTQTRLIQMCSDFQILQVGADVLQKLVTAALSLIDIQYVKFDVLMNGVSKRFKFVSTLKTIQLMQLRLSF